MPQIFSRRSFLLTSLSTTTMLVSRGHENEANADDTSQRFVDWLDEVQTPPSTIPPDAPSLASEGINDAGRPFATWDDWLERRRLILQAWIPNVLRPVSLGTESRPQIRVLEEDRAEGVVRQRISYETEPGEMTEAYLLRPERIEKPCPGVVVFHSTVQHSIRQPAGLADDREKAFGWHLAKAGCITLSPRNFLWPTNDRIDAQAQADKFLKRHPSSTGMYRMLFDASLAVTILQQQPDVDKERIGAVGHSLGAKEVLYLAAFDERVKCTVSSEGGIGLSFSNWHDDWYLGKQIKAEGFAHDHHQLLALCAPRPFLLIGGDSADGDKSWPYIDAAMPVYRLAGGRPLLGLFNHKQGHAVPPIAEKRIQEWLLAGLSRSQPS